MVVILACVGAGVCLTLWAVVYRRLGAIPIAVWRLVKHERRDEWAKAQSALQEATAARVAPILWAIREHEEQLATALRAQIAEAEIRARVVERRSSDAAVALSAASTLVRELRELRDGLRAVVEAGAPPKERTRAEDDSALDERRTVEIHGEDRPSEEELTRVGARPEASVVMASRGTRGAS